MRKLFLASTILAAPIGTVQTRTSTPLSQRTEGAVMKRFLLAGIAALPFLLPALRADAQVATYCVNCSSLANQLISDAKQAQQYLTEVSQLQTQFRQYQNMVTNSVALPMEVFAGVQADINQVRNLANIANLLSGNSGTILSRLQTAGAYTGSAAFLPSNMSNQFTQWQQTEGNAASSLGRTLGVQQSQQQGYTTLQTTIQQHSQTAAGQMQAIQAGVEMSALTNTQLQQIQATDLAAAQEVATRDMISADRQAAQDAQVQQFLAPPDQPLTGYARY
jgi:P-type conjugative transfer protein TrbJ